MKRQKPKRLTRQNITPYIVDEAGNLTRKRRVSTPAIYPHVSEIKSFPKNDPKRSAIFVWINTFNRPNELKLLLGDIHKNKQSHKLKILVIDDASTLDYDTVLDSFVGKLNIEYHKMDNNHGKKKYWKLCSYGMNEIRANQGYDYYMKIDDDGRLVDRFFERCCYIWESIKDIRKICLNFRLDSREGKKVWTNITPEKMNFNDISIYRSQWVDMDFFTTMDFFTALRYRIIKPPEVRWRNPHASSGTGRDISTRLASMGYNLYLTTQSLVRHDDHDSHMNPRERARTPLVTKPFKERNYGIEK